MGKDLFLNDSKKRILFIVSAFFLMYFLSYIIDPYSKYWQLFFKRDYSEIFQDIIFTLSCSVIFSEFSIYISKKLNKVILWTIAPAQRLIIETTLNILMVLLVNIILALFCVDKLGDKSPGLIGLNISLEDTKGLIHWIVVSSVIAFMIMGVNTGNYLIQNWKDTALRAAELSQAAIETELHSLKLQVDPHFVFNNLSVLSELILEDQQLGYEYAENFSKIYRYMLTNSKKDRLTLDEELKFLEAYMFLIKHRMGSGVSFKIDVDEQSKLLSIPPMTLQLLIENAIKHNKTNKKKPLKIHIFSKADAELVVKNTFIPIENPVNSSGIGLKNIERRYSLMSDRIPTILNDGLSFIVTLPLLKL